MKNRKRNTRTRVPIMVGLGIVFVLALFFAAYSLSPFRHERPVFPEVSPAEENSSPNTFTRLEIGVVSYINGQIRIEGITNLPDGGKLIVDFDVATPESDSDTAVSEHTMVEQGCFSVSVTPPHTPAFTRGPYTVIVLFSPRIQPESVLALVGRNGEKLTGPLAHDTFGFRVLEAKVRFDLSLSEGAVWKQGKSRI